MAESKDIKQLFKENFIQIIGKDAKQKDVAEKIGTTRQTVSNWISGNAVPDMCALVKIASAYHVSVDYLLGLTDQPTNDKDLASAADYLGISDKTAKSMQAGKSYLENVIMNLYIDAFTDVLPQIANEVNEIVKRHFYEKHIFLFVAQLHGIEVTPEEIVDEGIDAIKHKLGKNSPEWTAFRKDCENRIHSLVKEGIFATSADIDYHKYLTKNILDQLFDNVCKELMKNDVFKRYDDFYKTLIDWFQSDSDNNIYNWQPFMVQKKLEELTLQSLNLNKWQSSRDFLDSFDVICKQIYNNQPKKAGD